MSNKTQSNTVSSAKALRMQLLANGYVPTANIGKACYMKSWPTIVVTEAVLDEWDRRHSRFQDTGLRIEGGLAVIDLDINHEVIDRVARKLEEEEPRLAQALIRFGKGRKEAWFVRTAEPFGRLHTRRWLAPGDTLEDGTHVVECFGGASPRQFGAFGAHTRDAAGGVEIAYEWADDVSPLTVPLAELVELTKADIIKIVDASEQEMEAAGFTVVQRTQKGEDVATKAYDLTPDMRFECNDDRTRTLAELEEAAGEDGLRCSASWLEPGGKHSITRCIIGRTHNGALTIWDSASGVSHMPADKAPIADENRQSAVNALADRLKRLAEQEEEKKARRRAELSSEDDGLQATGKALVTWAFCPNQQLQVVPIYADSVGAGMTLTNFRTLMLPWAWVEIGPKGGEKKINPADVWASSDRRITVEGLRMRPDMPRPIFEEGGKKYVNIYRPVELPGSGGDASVGIEFFEQLLPDAGERLWFTRWSAFKLRNPAIPGPAVVMVARSHGTGRGTLGELWRRMVGARYLKTLPFDIFAGKTYQSQYNSWGAESLMVVVNESSDAGGGSVYAAKRDTYERLKDLIDPRPIERHFVRHGLPPFTAPSFTSYIVATNHPDALPLPADDRRFWVGTNGDPRDEAFWARVNAWMEVPENVGAFVRYLEEFDLADYSPFATPPMTEGKLAMTELATSSVDRALEDAITTLPGQLLLPDQIIDAMKADRNTNGHDYPDKWEAIARRGLQSKLYRVGQKDGPGWVLKLENKKHPIYARTRAMSTKWANADPEERRREVLRNGVPGNATSIASALAGLSLVGKE